MIKRFEDLDVWQEGFKLSVVLCRELRDSRNFGLRDQIQRSAISMPSNIAEGFERKSNKEFIQYLHIAQGSCAELRTQLMIAKEAQLIELRNIDESIERTCKISAMLHKLIQTRKTKF
ncbi:four helix bundle protein [Tunicatimonas pelagia]|uniref:four helix bundle protein n=1 Tax=Tunicatimonas pelagia TaxID=931531 RepID=UPI0026663316|nr:four helix bundle protein [Tunicatimonas pelagia]WKN45673.1 four helix bundle protein [Tunicatimonas pelagia]